LLRNAAACHALLHVRNRLSAAKGAGDESIYARHLFKCGRFSVEAVNDRRVDHLNSERRITKCGFAGALASPPADNLR
jgi:hypothetical protein